MGNEQNYISYRLDRSDELFEDAMILAQKGRWRSCVNRLYYACFHMVDALMFKNGVSSKTHEGLKTQFLLRYIKTGILEKKYGKLYSLLIDWRQESDYSAFVDFSENDVKPIIPEVKEFLFEIKTIINA